MARKKRTVKENFENLIKFISQKIGDDDIQIHLSESGNNEICLSHFSVEEYLGIINDVIEIELMDNLLAGNDISLLSDERTDETTRTHLTVFARLILSTTHTASDKFICARKLGESRTA